MAPHKDAVLSYFALSVVFLALRLAIVPIITGSTAPLEVQTQYWLAISLIGAAIFGVIIGLNATFGWSRGLLRRCGLHLPHVLDSAWDWKFSRFPPSLVMITLKDGSKVSGWLGYGSFVGSDPKDRDIYIEQIYDVDDSGTWNLKTPLKGIYISGGEIRTIEFFPDPTTGAPNG